MRKTSLYKIARTSLYSPGVCYRPVEDAIILGISYSKTTSKMKYS
jgi:hypothetical protein